MYRRWPGKAQLVADALRRRAEGDLPATPNTGSIRGDLLAAAARITSTIEGSDGPSFLGLVEGIRDDETLRELVTEQIAAASARAATALVEHARTRGENLVATHVTIAFDVLVSRLFLDALLRPDRTREHEQVRLVDEIVLPLATQ
jgi:hypothetical protein